MLGASPGLVAQWMHPTVERTNTPPLITPAVPHYPQPLNSLIARADTTIAYYDTTLNAYNWYFLPTHLTLRSQTGQDTQYVLNRYAERFTLPKVAPVWSTRYVDSVEVLFAPTTVTGADDSLVIELRVGQTLQEGQGGPTLFGFDQLVKPLDSFGFNVNDLTQNQIYDTVIPFNYKFLTSGTNKVDSSFFVCLYTPDTDLTVTQFAVRGDSVTFTNPLESPLSVADQDIYRGMWGADDPANPTYQYFENDFAGITFPQQDGSNSDYFYTNFVILVHMSNQLTNAVDVTGKPQFVLEPNFPNPVSSSTEIDYNLATAEPVTLSVYNQMGEKVSSVVSEMQGAGSHSANFNIGTLPDGMYYYKLQAGDFTSTHTLVIAR